VGLEHTHTTTTQQGYAPPLQSGWLHASSILNFVVVGICTALVKKNIDASTIASFVGLLWDLSIRTQQQRSKATHHVYSLVGCMLVQFTTLLVSICTALIKQHCCKRG
jgi:hypothetical protein